MGMTMSEKVLASHSGHDSVSPGEFVEARIDRAKVLDAFLGTGVGVTDMAIVFATGKLWFRVPETIKVLLSGKIPSYIMGKDIIHHVLSVMGVDGANYKTIEFYGRPVKELSIDGRMTLANM